MRPRSLVPAIAASFVFGCAVHPRPGGSLPDGGVRPRHILTAEEIAPNHFGTVYQALANLRPEFLRTRGPSPAGAGVQVYLNGMRLGELDQLHGIRASDVTEIRYLTPPETTLRFGTGHPAGAILITFGARRP